MVAFTCMLVTMGDCIIMADITMCNGIGCEKKDQCYRHTATPSRYQSYFLNSPIKVDKDNKQKCSLFWSNK